VRDFSYRKWHCDRFFSGCFHLILSTTCCFQQQKNEIRTPYLQTTERFWVSDSISQKRGSTCFFSASPKYSIYFPAQIAAGLRIRMPQIEDPDYVVPWYCGIGCVVCGVWCAVCGERCAVCGGRCAVGGVCLNKTYKGKVHHCTCTEALYKS